MRNLQELITLFNYVMFTESTIAFSIKKSVSFTMTYYSKDNKYLYSFNYGNDLKFLFNPETISEDEIQSMYYQVKVAAARCWNR